MRAASLFVAVSLSACSGTVSNPNSAAGDDGGPLNPLTMNGLALTSSIDGNGSGGNLKFVNVIPDSSGRCSLVKQGGCFVQDCRAAGAGASALQGVSAGEIDLNQGSSTVLKITPDAADKLYPAADATTPPWTAGDTVTFVAKGSDVPAFNIAMTAPAPLTINSPMPSGTTPASYSASMDLVVRWKPVDGSVTVELVQADAAADLSSSLRVLCEWVGMPGAGAIPSSVVGLLSTDSSLSNAIQVGGSSVEDITLGGYWVHASLINARGGAFTLTP